jgi:Bacterial regulatory helix-turn-helix protein, lysR family
MNTPAAALIAGYQARATGSSLMDLPPVILLRAFDAAGRHNSFRRAAELLHVTPSTMILPIRPWVH